MSFYVTLPTNGSMNLFPNNNPSQFSITFPQTIEVNNQYEVGLAEIQFPNSYFNVLEIEVWVVYYLPEIDEKTEWKGNPPVLIKLPAGLYDTIEDFIMEIIKALITKEAVMEFYYNKASKRAGIRLYQKDIEVTFSDTLKDILALPTSRMTGD